MYRITIDGGAQLCRAVSTIGLVADRIREQPDGRRHVRDTAAPHVVATVDLQRGTFVVFVHGAALTDLERWPAWAEILYDQLLPDPAAFIHPTEENP